MARMSVKPGALRDRIRIETLTETRDAYGGVTQTWATRDQRWAAIMPRSGDEFYSGDQTKANVTHLIQTRYDPNIGPDDRIVYDGRTFQIAAVLNRDGKRIMHDLLCTEQITGAEPA